MTTKKVEDKIFGHRSIGLETSKVFTTTEYVNFASWLNGVKNELELLPSRFVLPPNIQDDIEDACVGLTSLFDSVIYEIVCVRQRIQSDGDGNCSAEHTDRD